MSRRSSTRAGTSIVGVLAAFGAGLAGALALSACDNAETLAPGKTLTVAVTEYRIRPAAIVVPDGHLHIVVENVGRLSHDLIVSAATATVRTVEGPTGTRTYTTIVAARAPDLAPGRRETIRAHLAPGRYRLSSDVGDDALLGVAGTLTVTAK